MPYADGFVIPIRKKNLDAYRRMARRAGKIWMEHGAVAYHEAAGDDIDQKEGMGRSFKRLAGLKPGETVLFSWIVYRSRAHRDRVNAKVMADPRIAKMMEQQEMPFEVKRMAYGGFRTIVDF